MTLLSWLWIKFDIIFQNIKIYFKQFQLFCLLENTFKHYQFYFIVIFLFLNNFISVSLKIKKKCLMNSYFYDM